MLSAFHMSGVNSPTRNARAENSRKPNCSRKRVLGFNVPVNLQSLNP